jgi:hypothetical protein
MRMLDHIYRWKALVAITCTCLSLSCDRPASNPSASDPPAPPPSRVARIVDAFGLETIPDITDFNLPAVPAEFKEHYHEEEDVRIKAPADWKITKRPFRKQNDHIIALNSPSTSFIDLFSESILVIRHELPYGIILMQFVEGHERNMVVKENATIESGKWIRFGERIGYRWVSSAVTDGISLKMLVYVIQEGPTVYFIQFTSQADKFKLYELTAEQIIGSFQVGDKASKPPFTPAAQ